jgi:chloramphenicol-sensitive protein RarD
MPLYLSLLAPAGPVEVIAHRVVWSLALCAVIVAATGRRRELARVLRRPRTVASLAVSGAVLSVNWLVFVYSVSSGQVIEGSLGYFINPLITVALGVGLLHERLRRAQWAALAVGAAAVVVIAVGYGRLPWIALTLGVSFAVYAYIEKAVGAGVTAVTSLTVETLVVAPFALAFLAWLAAGGGQRFTGLGAWHGAAMAGVGLITVVPLLLFNGAARRLPLSVVGMLQYLCPALQFVSALAVFHEPMAPARWVGFAAVWAALAILAADGLITARKNPRVRR